MSQIKQRSGELDLTYAVRSTLDEVATKAKEVHSANERAEGHLQLLKSRLDEAQVSLISSALFIT